MKSILLIISLLVTSISSFSQDSTLVNGKIQRVSYYQGGRPLPEAYRLPKPLVNFSVLIIRYNGTESIPTVLEMVTTDSLGQFSIQLPPGEYGYVLIEDKNTLHKGQYLPTPPNDLTNPTPNNATRTSDNWTMNSTGPFKVTKDGNNDLTLTHYAITVCYKCP